MAASIGKAEYVEYYQRDGLCHVGPLWTIAASNTAAEHPDAPIDIYQWILNSLRGIEKRRDVFADHSMFQRQTSNAITTFLDSTRLNRTCSLYRALIDGGSEALVLAVVAAGPAQSDLEVLPVGIALPLKQALHNCKGNAPGNWPSRAYEVIGREDMARQVAEAWSAGRWDAELRTSDISCPAERKHADHEEEKDGTESAVNPISNLRFREDRRLKEVRRLLQSAKPCLAKAEIDYNRDEETWKAEQQKYLLTLSNRVFARPTGRAALTYKTFEPSPAETFAIPGLKLAAQFPPMSAIVDAEAEKVKTLKDWPEFHNGVAAGLSIVSDSEFVDGPWIAFNAPVTEFDNKQQLSRTHAGVLLGLGLTGNLKRLDMYILLDYMNRKQDFTAIALLLGLAATHFGSCHPGHHRLCYSHIEANSIGKVAGVEIKPTAIVSVGLLYLGTVDRLQAEKMLHFLQQIHRGDPDFEEYHRESCAIACGFALGFVTLGASHMHRSAGIADMQLTDQLLQLALGQSKPYVALSSTIALGLMHLKSNDRVVADKLLIPGTAYILHQVRPDVLLMRVLCRSLIMWDSIVPTIGWIRDRAQEALGTQGATHPTDAYKQARWNILAGAAFAIGLKYAGSQNPLARSALLEIINEFAAQYGHSATSFSQKLNRSVLRGCLDVLLPSLCIIMAGSGDVECMRVVRSMHLRQGADVTYGSHMATNMALGFLFLGAGRCTFGTSNTAVATLLCALFPQYPISPSNTNRGHLNAARHLWALAVEPRCLVTRDVETLGICSVPITIKLHEQGTPSGTYSVKMITPALLPDYGDIISITVDSPRYWTSTLDVARNSAHSALLADTPVLLVKRKLWTLLPPQDGTEHSWSLPEAVPADLDNGVSKTMIAGAPEITAFRDFVSSGHPVLLQALDESFKLDRPDILIPYLWLNQILADLPTTLTSSVAWNVKLILELYQRRPGTVRDDTQPNDSRKHRPPPLMARPFVNHLRAQLDEHFRVLVNQFPDLTTKLRTCMDPTDSSPLGTTSMSDLDSLEQNQISSFLVYKEWPARVDVDWFRRSLAVTPEIHEAADPHAILVVALAANFPHLDASILECVARYVTTTS
ncbi:Anaphase-promoting complex subunit 1 [Thoreauomyces humboldtii]|nr:Anaphase-promoting complex subunit 1 [Thoreauomyces humboldtii]